MTPRPAGLVLAAGAGTRYGAPKALVELDGQPLVAHACRVVEDGGCAPVVAVAGAEAERVRVAATAAGAEVTINDRWEQGLSSSLIAGLRALRGRTPAAVIVLVDQPAIGPQAVARLRGAWERGAVAAVATYGGEPGHPVLLDATVWDEVTATAAGDAGARGWLRANPERVTFVPCDGTGDPADVDTPADLVALRHRRQVGGP